MRIGSEGARRRPGLDWADVELNGTEADETSGTDEKEATEAAKLLVMASLLVGRLVAAVKDTIVDVSVLSEMSKLAVEGSEAAELVVLDQCGDESLERVVDELLDE
ncbi:hypothetical protein SEPCBS57363_006194 [Sporothrix epigloea]|uniref:Uncharacterized protein n=1 Tax=Sporothrix epigloea TaxID=1892477 RepID=A0ABP0E5Y1_9PEZI